MWRSSATAPRLCRPSPTLAAPSTPLIRSLLLPPSSPLLLLCRGRCLLAGTSLGCFSDDVISCPLTPINLFSPSPSIPVPTSSFTHAREHRHTPFDACAPSCTCARSLSFLLYTDTPSDRSTMQHHTHTHTHTHTATLTHTLFKHIQNGGKLSCSLILNTHTLRLSLTQIPSHSQLRSHAHIVITE